MACTVYTLLSPAAYAIQSTTSRPVPSYVVVVVVAYRAAAVSRSAHIVQTDITKTAPTERLPKHRVACVCARLSQLITTNPPPIRVCHNICRKIYTRFYPQLMRKNHDITLSFTDSLHLMNNLLFRTSHENTLACDVILVAKQHIMLLWQRKQWRRTRDDVTNALPSNQGNVICHSIFK